MAFLFSRLLQTIKIPILRNCTTTFKSSCLVPRSLYVTKNLFNLTAKELETSKTSQHYGDLFKNVNNDLNSPESCGRLFAVVHLCGKQFKVTSGDIIVVEGYWPPTVADRIRLEKVLVVGGKNFTLFGRPILDTRQVDVQATIIEKTLSHTKTHFKKKRRKQYVRINFQRSPHTMIRINSIDIVGKINEPLKNLNAIKIF